MKTETATMNTTDLDSLIFDSIGKGQEIIALLISGLITDYKYSADDISDWCVSLLNGKNIYCGKTLPKEHISVLKEKYEPNTTYIVVK